MKKRFLSVFLALALCIGLAVPAFAADSEVPAGSYTVDLNKPDSAGMGVDGEFMVRYLNSGRSYDEAKPRVDLTRTLPQGSEFTWTGLRSSHNVYFRFFTDLDNDGTYDERLVVKESGKYALAPYEEKYASSLTQVSGKPQSASTFASMLEEMGGKLSKDDSGVMTLAISSDSLCEFFGGSTLFEWGVMKNGASVVAKGTMLFAAGEQNTDPEPPAAPQFTDVPAGAFYANAVNWAVGQDITNGTGNNKFGPGQDCTHAQILTFLYRAARGGGTAAPEDMDKAISWAREKGMIGEGFNPEAKCTRADAVTYIWRAFGSPTGEGAPSGLFTDVSPANSPADQLIAVYWALGMGITDGTSATTFSPGKVCNRGTIVTFLHRAYVPEVRLTSK